MEITSKHRKYLRSCAHSIKPHIVIGKNGLNKSSLNAIYKHLIDHELIKIKVKHGIKKDIELKIASKLECFIVGSIGKILIVYKMPEDLENAKINFL